MKIKNKERFCLQSVIKLMRVVTRWAFPARHKCLLLLSFCFESAWKHRYFLGGLGRMLIQKSRVTQKKAIEQPLSNYDFYRTGIYSPAAGRGSGASAS